ncbi:MAG: 4Fe-4S binding protein [Tannerellaceae bacterium]|nr:4Fe-4S binding protein [Tannerellaceae bacterium]
MITAVVLIWLGFIVLSPLVGRIGCGWFCFMGTVQDFVGRHAFFQSKWRKPFHWNRFIVTGAMFGSAFAFYFLNRERGITHGFALSPDFIPTLFDSHYKLVWVIDIAVSALFAILLNRRWVCKNACPIGALCAMGAKHSRLMPVADTAKCISCGKCEKECPVGIPVLEYIRDCKGLVTNAECLLCGKCAEVCKPRAMSLKFVWNRIKYCRMN